MKNKKQIILTVAFAISLLPMLLNQYGSCKGVQEITGLINLTNPIGLAAVIIYVIGVWAVLKNRRTNVILGAIGVVGIVISELTQFFTWHYMTITEEVSLENSISMAFPEFCFGLVISILMVVAYFMIIKKFEGEH